MTKIDIFSGFLGAGKTTLIKKLIKEAFAGEKLVLIENEFGEIGIDGVFLQDAGIKINELNSGCICCSLVGDFAEALKKVYAEYAPDRILIEPSGVGKLSDVIRAVESANLKDCKINTYTAVVDAGKCKMYMKNFGEFFNDQIETASCIVFSHADVVSAEKLETALGLVRKHNPSATVVTTPWAKLDGKQILAAMEHGETLETEIEKLSEEERCGCHGHHEHEDGECGCHGHHEHEDGECGCHGHHHHEHEDGECGCHGHHHHHEHEDGECGCHGHHHHEHEDGECGCHGHHHHEHEDGECGCHGHHHHEHEDGECGCHGHHHHEHDHHHHHHADEVFTSWGVETGRTFTAEQIERALSELSDEKRFGVVLRAKGIVPCTDGGWIHFDYIPGESNVRKGSAAYTGRLCVIGSKLNEERLAQLFNV